MDEFMDDRCCATCGYNKSDNEDVAVCEKISGSPEEKAIDACCCCYDNNKDPLPLW